MVLHHTQSSRLIMASVFYILSPFDSICYVYPTLPLAEHAQLRQYLHLTPLMCLLCLIFVSNVYQQPTLSILSSLIESVVCVT